MIRTYTELMEIPTYLQRFQYLKLDGKVGDQTYETGRWFNQQFYKSKEWRDFRREIVLRDYGCDLADPEHPYSKEDTIVIHHLNPISLKDIREHSDLLLDPENAISCTSNTHRAIHFGDVSMVMPIEFVRRTPYDTSPWRYSK